MKEIRIHSPLKHPKDCMRIQRIFDKNGVAISLKQAEELWGIYSAEWENDWLGLSQYDDTSVFAVLNKYWEEK